MEAIKQFIMSGEIPGLLFVALGVIVGVFKQHWLIAGVNAASSKELEKVDIVYVRKYFGIFCGGFGALLFFSPFVFRYLDIMMYYHSFRSASHPVFVLFLFLYGFIKRDRIHKKNDKI